MHEELRRFLTHMRSAFSRQATYLASPEIYAWSAYAAKLVPSDLDKSKRSRMNFTRIEVLAAVARNSGRVFRIAMAATCSEGVKPGRTVRIHEPNDCQTRCGLLAERI